MRKLKRSVARHNMEKAGIAHINKNRYGYGIFHHRICNFFR